uniref:Transmembrane protein n=1 Tax=Zea mays TaxID=4577 RepID=A0A804UJH7_MAIZE
MAAQGSLVMWRAVFAALGLLMVATLVYTLATDGSPFRLELFTPWMVATLADFYVNVIAISAWVIYKEANWVSSAVWVVLLFCFGSAVTCAYIVKKLLEVTSAGSSQDPLDLLFIRQGNLSQRKCSYVVIGRVIFSILGIFMAAVVTYTVITDGLPFRKELLTPWMAATLIDFYINVFAISLRRRPSTRLSNSLKSCGPSQCASGASLSASCLLSDAPRHLHYRASGRNVACLVPCGTRWRPHHKRSRCGLARRRPTRYKLQLLTQEPRLVVWVAHKESSWISTTIWIVLLICFGSITTCGYIVIQLFKVSYQDPIYHVLLNSHSKYGIPTSL